MGNMGNVDDNIIYKITFEDCSDSLSDILPYEDIATDKIYIFSAECGKMTDEGEEEFKKVFSDTKTGLLAYADEGYPNAMPWYKPDFSPDTLESFFYIGNIFAVRGQALKTEWEDNISLYDFVLKLSDIEVRAVIRFIHIPKVLFINDSDEESTKLYGFDGNALTAQSVGESEELVSVIIPSRDNSGVLDKCLNTLTKYTNYKDYEIIVVDNGSSDEERLCISGLIEKYGFSYIYGKYDFNFSKMCNIGAAKAQGTQLLFLNDDIEIIEPDWLGRLLEVSSRAHTGAVGAKLYYPRTGANKKPLIQHVGITNMGIGPAHKLCRTEDNGNLYHGRNIANYNMIAVTGACMMVKREIFEAAGGFDEDFAVAYNDVELCFRIHKAGFYNVVVNNAVLIHHESLSRGADISPERKKRLIDEKHRLYAKHPDMRAKDMFYSPNLVQWRWDASYSENLIFDYDREVIPLKAEAGDIKRLPKEHSGRYIKKLTGESLLMMNIDGVDYIDSVENMYGRDMVLIRGWAVVRGRNNSDKSCKKTLLLKSLKDDSIYFLGIHSKPRKDVAELFDKNTKNAKKSGINVLFDALSIPKGEYTVGVLIEKHRRYMAWSTYILKI